MCGFASPILRVVSSVALSVTLWGVGQADSADQPNVLFIAVDDMRVELGCYGDTIVKSPNIDRLASWGTRFENAYCQQSVCNPSRASVMTGLRPTTLGICNLETHFREVLPDIVTLPQLFQQRGYFTQNIGKIYHNWRQDDFKGDPLSWSTPAVMHYANHGADVPMVEPAPKALIDLPRAQMFDVPDEAYFDGRIADLAVTALKERAVAARTEGEPFFLAVGFWKPHAPFNAPKKYWDMYERTEIAPASPNRPPTNVPAIAMHDSREIRRGFKARPNRRPNSDEAIALRHGYYAAISYVDAQIGKLLDSAEELGLRENTIIVFWSDHGYHLGEKTLWAKTSNFELDAHVPMLIAGPGCRPNSSSDAVVELLDLYPTIADLAGIEPLQGLEGDSLQSILSGDENHVSDIAFTTHPRPAYPDRQTGPEAMGYSMRTDRYRYTEWRDAKTGKPIAREFYDHESNPDESENVISSSLTSKAVIEGLAEDLSHQFPRMGEPLE